MIGKRKARSNNVDKILNNDYTLTEEDFYPPEDKRMLESNLIDIYDGKRNAYHRYLIEFNYELEKDGYFD